MPASMQEAFAKALAKTQAQVAQPIPAEWDDETPETKIEEVTTMHTQTQTTSPSIPVPTYSQELVPPAPRVLNNSEYVFEYVRDNPGLTRGEVIRAVAAMGVNESSSASILSQLVKQSQVKEEDGKLTAIVNNYSPLKHSSKFRLKEREKVVADKRRAALELAWEARRQKAAQAREEKAKAAAREARKAAKLAKQAEAEKEAPTARVVAMSPALGAPYTGIAAIATPSVEFNAEAFVGGLTLRQARAVYDFLGKIFKE